MQSDQQPSQLSPRMCCIISVYMGTSLKPEPISMPLHQYPLDLAKEWLYHQCYLNKLEIWVDTMHPINILSQPVAKECDVESSVLHQHVRSLNFAMNRNIIAN